MSLREDAEQVVESTYRREDYDAAKRLLAALEHAEVMWRVRYAGGGPLSMHSRQENARFRAITDEEYGHHDAIIERVLVIREEA